VEPDDHGRRHWLHEPNTKPNWNSYTDTVTKHIPGINSNANTSDTNTYGDTHSDTTNHTYSTTNHTYSTTNHTYSATNHTYSSAGYTYSNATGSNPDTNADADSNGDSKSNTCRAGSQSLDSDAGSDGRKRGYRRVHRHRNRAQTCASPSYWSFLDGPRGARCAG
jgi:hypothetical protein